MPHFAVDRLLWEYRCALSVVFGALGHYHSR